LSGGAAGTRFRRSISAGHGTVAAGTVGRADFNGDGLVDVVVARALGGPPVAAQDTFPIGILLNDGKGRLLDRPARIFEGRQPRNQWVRQLVVADFNGDGRPDVFLPDTGPEAPNYGPPPGRHDTLILSTPRGRLRDATAGIPQQSAFTHSAATLPSHTQRNDQQVLLNDGRGFFRILPGALPEKPFGIAGEGQAVVPADLDRDGRVDLLLSYTSGQQRVPDDCVNNFVSARYVQVLMGNGDGTFRDETASRPPQPDLHGASQAFYLALDLDDLDGDGRPELFTQLLIPPNDRPAYAPAFRNDGRGSFGPLPLGYPVSSLDTTMHAFVDLSGTGRRDVFLVTWSRRGDLFSRRLQRGKAIRPGAPAGVRVTTDPATGRRVVAWPYVWGAARYEVWRDGRRVARTKLMRWVDTAAPPGARYAVRALNAAGVSAFSAPASLVAAPSVGG